MLQRWDPFRDLMSIQGELNTLFGRTFGGGEMEASGAWIPPMDVYETSEKIVVALELPGIAAADVDVSVEDSTLRIKGRREFVYKEATEDQFQRIERRYGEFTRSLTLPTTADPNGIEATFDRGVLTVDVPRREEAKPRKITVKAKG
jgi:HSP20 family protein